MAEPESIAPESMLLTTLLCHSRLVGSRMGLFLGSGLWQAQYISLTRYIRINLAIPLRMDR